MDAKDLRSETALGAPIHDGSSKYAQSGITHQSNTNKTYQDIGSNTMAKVDVPTPRPCAIIGPDRVIPSSVSNGAHLRKSPIDPWPCSEKLYRHPTEYPHKMSDYQPTRNISPRQTFQENMQRIMVTPTYNSINPKFNLPLDAKYCEVPYSVNPANNNEHKSVRVGEMPLSSVSAAVTRSSPHVWPLSNVNVRPIRPYGAPELYQYSDYPSCAGPRPLPMVRPHRTIHDEPSHIYSDRYIHETNIRFRPYPPSKERYPQARYEYINNYSNALHPPPPFPPHKYDSQKSIPPHPYPLYPQVPLKYIDRRMGDPIINGYQRANQQANINVTYNPMIHPYGPLTSNSIQNNLYPYPSDNSNKTIPLNKLPYNNNKTNYSFSDIPYPHDVSRSQFLKNDTTHSNFVHSIPQHNIYRKDTMAVKNYEYIHHYRNMDQCVNVGNPLMKHPMRFSPNNVAISPSDSNASNDTTQTHGTSQEDCGYVSQSSTTSIRSIESNFNPILNERSPYRMPDYRYGYVPRNTPAQISIINRNSKSKKDLDVRQFLQMWNEGDDEFGDQNKEDNIKNDSKSSNILYEGTKNSEELYVLGLVNVPSEELSKYDHIQKISKLPENIKGYNNIELLNQFEEAIELSNMSNTNVKPHRVNIHQFKSLKGCVIKQPIDTLPRPISPLDVEAKISQSVIHKEVGCNFEIKPCSPKMLNVEIATPIQNILDERIIEKVTNPTVPEPLIECNNHFSNSSVCGNVTDVSKVANCTLNDLKFNTNDSTETIKANYGLQDLEYNSGICLASLPRLDNDIELNFPEINQQFLNANKTESILTTGILKDLPTLEIENIDGIIQKDQHKLGQINEVIQPCLENIESEKEIIKLSKYRKCRKVEIESKENEIKSNSTNNVSLRTDSVIIKNPDTIKNQEHEYTLENDSMNISNQNEQEFNILSNNEGEETNCLNIDNQDLNRPTNNIHLVIAPIQEQQQVYNKSPSIAKSNNDSIVNMLNDIEETKVMDMDIAIDFTLRHNNIATKHNSDIKKDNVEYNKNENEIDDINSFVNTNNSTVVRRDGIPLEINNSTPKTKVLLSTQTECDSELKCQNKSENSNLKMENNKNIIENLISEDSKHLLTSINRNKTIVDNYLSSENNGTEMLSRKTYDSPKKVELNSIQTGQEPLGVIENENRLPENNYPEKNHEKDCQINNTNTNKQNHSTNVTGVCFTPCKREIKNENSSLNSKPPKCMNTAEIEDSLISQQHELICKATCDKINHLSLVTACVNKVNRTHRKRLCSSFIQNLMVIYEGHSLNKLHQEHTATLKFVSCTHINSYPQMDSDETDTTSIEHINEKLHIKTCCSDIEPCDSNNTLVQCESETGIICDDTSKNINNISNSDCSLPEIIMNVPNNKDLEENNCSNDLLLTNINKCELLKGEYSMFDDKIKKNHSEIIKPQYTPENTNLSNNNLNELDRKEIEENCKITQKYDARPNKHSVRLKRSLSDSALALSESSNIKNKKIDNMYNLTKKRKISPFDVEDCNFIEEDFCNIIQTNRRNSISTMYKDENVSFCILIDNDYILEEEESNELGKICYAEISEDCLNNINDMSSNLKPSNTEKITDNDKSYDNISKSKSIDHNTNFKIDGDETYAEELVSFSEIEKTNEETWIENVACIETVISNDIAEDITISAPVSPEENDLSDSKFDSNTFTFGGDMNEHMDKVKCLYNSEMCQNDAEIIEALYRTPQMDVKKTLYIQESQYSDESSRCYDKDSLERILSESNENDADDFIVSGTIQPFLDVKNTKKIQNDKEYLTVENVSPLHSVQSYLNINPNSNDKELGNLDEIFYEKTQCDMVNSCELGSNYMTSYNQKEEYFYTSSPEVSSTTSEEKSCSILLKITNCNGSISSQINEFNAKRKNELNCKLNENNENMNYSNSLTRNRPLITKAAQKYIPPLKETICDLKVKLPLPQHSLKKLKILKISKDKPKVLNVENKNRNIIKPDIPKKSKPKFEDVLKSIDEIQIKMHKEKNKKSKHSIPKVVIKKNENGAHYASTSHKKDTFNPDLTGRKWQPWVFLEKNYFIDKMAINKKIKAVFSRRKNTYVLAEKFRKYKPARETKFVISQSNVEDISSGKLKYTIRLKHAY